MVLGDITLIAIGHFDIILRKESSRDVQYVRHRVVYFIKGSALLKRNALVRRTGIYFTLRK